MSVMLLLSILTSLRKTKVNQMGLFGKKKKEQAPAPPEPKPQPQQPQPPAPQPINPPQAREQAAIPLPPKQKEPEDDEPVEDEQVDEDTEDESEDDGREDMSKDELRDLCIQYFEDGDKPVQVHQQVKDLYTFEGEDISVKVITGFYSQFKRDKPAMVTEPETAPESTPEPAPKTPPAPAAPVSQNAAYNEFQASRRKLKSEIYYDRFQEAVKAGDRMSAERWLEAADRALEAEIDGGSGGKDKDTKYDKLVDGLINQKLTADPLASATAIITAVGGLTKGMEKITGGSQNPDIAMAQLIAGEIRGAREDLVDTAYDLTGTNKERRDKRRRQAEMWQCSNCGAKITKDASRCPNCKMELAPIQDEVYDKKTPPPTRRETPAPKAPAAPPAPKDEGYPDIPDFVLSNIKNFYRLANMVTNGDDPVRKSSALWEVAGPDDKAGAFYVAQYVGVERILKIVEPYRTHPRIRRDMPDVDKVLDVIKSEKGIAFLNGMMSTVRSRAAQDNFTLTAQQKAGLDEMMGTVVAQRKAFRTTCPVCNTLVSLPELANHLKSAHPPKGQAPAPAPAAPAPAATETTPAQKTGGN